MKKNKLISAYYLKISLPFIFIADLASAQIDMNFRRANAAALYEMLETSGNVVRDTAQMQPALDLSIYGSSSNEIGRGQQNGLNYLDVKTANMIQSAAPATKITNACKASGEMSVEIWIESKEGVEKRSVNFPGQNSPQPLRMISLAENLRKNNFYIGHFYDNGEFLYSAVNTNNVETPDMDPTKPTSGGNLINENILKSQRDQIIINDPTSSNPPQVSLQKIIMTYNSKLNLGKVFISDRSGVLSKSIISTGQLNGNFSDWYPNAKLSLANIATTPSAVGNSPPIAKCATNEDIQNPANNCGAEDRYWKGKIFLAAVYCKALTETQILGAAANIQYKNPIVPISTNTTVSDSRKKAIDIFQRITGVKPLIYDPAIDQMTAEIEQNRVVEAAAIATKDNRFLNITVRDFASKMSNRAETIDVPMNDFTATVIGAVRDNVDARDLLYKNITYMGDTTKVAAPSDLVFDILKSNNHYASLDLQRADFAAILTNKDKNGQPLTQKIFNGKNAEEMPTPAGLLTSRAWMSEHAIAGTNRRLVEYNFKEFLCTPMEQVADSQGPDNVVARDIDRFPGGSNAKFNSTCKACHTVMDGFRPAFAYMTFNGGYTMHTFTSPSVATQEEENDGKGMFKSKEPGATNVHDKLNKNGTNFAAGKITTDDSWTNNANYGLNTSYFNWKSTSGKGLPAFGKMISDSKQFPICMAKRIYKQVCKREPAISDMDMINKAALDFSSATGKYNLKFLFQKIVSSPECLGGN